MKRLEDTSITFKSTTFYNIDEKLIKIWEILLKSNGITDDKLKEIFSTMKALDNDIKELSVYAEDAILITHYLKD